LESGSIPKGLRDLIES